MKTALIFALIAIAFVAGCIGQQAGQPGEKELVKVGVIAPLTGGQAVYGEGMRKGLDMALNEVGNVRLVYEDEQSDAKAAVTAFTKLTDVDGVKVVIGPVLSGSVLAVAPLAEQKRVIVLSPTATAAKITDAGDYTFRIRETARLHGRAIAEYAISRNWTKAALMNANAEAALSYADTFDERFAELGGTVVAKELYEKDARDMRTQAEKVRAASSDFVYFTGFAADIGLAMKQLRQLGYEEPFLTTPAIEDKVFFTNAAGAAEAALYTSPFDPDAPAAAEFRQKYDQAYNDSNFAWYVANAYDSLKLVSKIAEECGDDTGCFKQKLYATRDYPGASGTFGFDEKGDVARPLIFMSVRNDAFVKVAA